MATTPISAAAQPGQGGHRAFFHDGTYSTFRGREHGKPVDPPARPGWRFVVCLQNHDQIGNRAAGDRLPEFVSPRAARVGAVLLLTCPFTPMLFMGEEWAAGTRWPFFTSHPEPELAEAVSKGRLAEFAEHGWDTATHDRPAGPGRLPRGGAGLGRAGPGRPREMLEFYRALIRLRRDEPELADPQLDRVEAGLRRAGRLVRIRRGAPPGGGQPGRRATGRYHCPDRRELVLATGSAEVIGTVLELRA